jgi:glycosyltransferase involved in cell wall biosynthesis
VRNYSEEATELVAKLIKEGHFDVIHAETFYIMPHIAETPIPIVLVEQTIEYKVYQHFVNSLPFFLRPLFMLDIIKLKQWERFYWRKAFLVGAVSESDRKEIVGLEPFIKPLIVPNGAGEEMVADSLPKKNLKKPTLLFIGNFSWLQNTEAAQYLIKKIYPLLKKVMPDIRIIIAGQNVKSKIRSNYDEGIRVMDIPPNDSEFVRKTYQDATLFVAPIFGPGGTRLKILAAMASGLPIVTTKTGVEGLDVKADKHVLIANRPEEFVKKIRHILSSDTAYNRIREHAYELVKDKYNWKKIATELEIAYEGIKKGENRS